MNPVAIVLLAYTDAEGAFKHQLWLYDRREDAEHRAATMREALLAEPGCALLACEVTEKFVISVED